MCELRAAEWGRGECFDRTALTVECVVRAGVHIRGCAALARGCRVSRDRKHVTAT